MKDKLYKMMNWPEIEAIVYGEEGKPESILGRHSVATYTLFQTFQPNAKEVVLVTGDDNKEYTMELADEAGFYAIAILGKVKGSYIYRITDKAGKVHECHDPYDYTLSLTKEEIDKWNSGIMYNAYEVMGSHVKTVNKTKGVAFRVWAPNAIRVSVVGDFNEWNGKSHPMMKDEATGIFSLFIPDIAEGTEYKYELSVKGGRVYYKLDPYSRLVKKSNSVVVAEKKFKWTDDEYLEMRKNQDLSKSRMNIYEIEMSSLFNGKGEVDSKALTSLVKKLVDFKFTHLQFICIPGEQYVINGGINPAGLQLVVNELHKAGIGAIIEWNPCFFPMNEDGLRMFDGTYLYGHMDDRQKYNPAYDGYHYNYARPQVTNYLLGDAFYLLSEFHIDGLHVDGLTSILFLDYGKYDGEWVANMYGGKENLDAIEFIKHANSIIHKNFSYAFTTTKEVGAFPQVTGDLKGDGLGFDLIWNNGYSEDYIDFVKGPGNLLNVSKLTDSFFYEYCENYILTMSKEDVLVANEYNHARVDDGATYFDYIPVPDEKKGCVRRASLAFMYARPGKKLIYKGQMDEKEGKALGGLYEELTAFFRLDRNQYGFEWISAINHGDGVIAFMRKDEYLNHSILVICNFSGNEYEEYKLGMPYEGKYKEIFNSEDKKFGGNVVLKNESICTDEDFYDGRANSLTLKLNPMSVSYYSYTPYTEEELLKIAQEKVARYKEKMEKEAKAKAKALSAKKIIDVIE